MVVVSGFSGAGKGTLMKRLLAAYDNYALSISMTTRQPRPGEREGVDYFFTTQENFEKVIAQDGLIEYACFCDHYYGTPKPYVEEKLQEGRDVILEIEMQGALKIKQKFPTALLLFVMPPSAAELKRRLVGRGTESPEVVKKRLYRALEEAEGIEAYDAVVINDDLEECTKTLHEIIRAAHSETARNRTVIADMKRELTQIVKGEE